MDIKYNIIGKFECCGNTMLVVKMNGAACIMTEEDYNGIIITERKHQCNIKAA